MASVAYPSDVAPEEYSQFAIHVYQWLSYIKDLTPPTVEELQEAGKMVNIAKRKENSKSLLPTSSPNKCRSQIYLKLQL